MSENGKKGCVLRKASGRYGIMKTEKRMPRENMAKSGKKGFTLIEEPACLADVGPTVVLSAGFLSERKPRENMAKSGKKGFTLIEVLVCLAIVGMTGVLLAGFLSPQLRIYQATADLTRDKAACEAVFNTVQERVRFGKDFSLSGNVLTYTLVTQDADEPGKQIDGDELGNDLWPHYRDEGKEVRIRFSLEGARLDVTISVFDTEKNEAVYETSQSIYCLNEGLTASESSDG